MKIKILSLVLMLVLVLLQAACSLAAPALQPRITSQLPAVTPASMSASPAQDTATAVPTASTGVQNTPEAEDKLQLATINASVFTLTSSEVADGGQLPAEYTCDGASATLPLDWGGAPAGTQSFAVIMHHVASPTDIHWYWMLYDIPADTTSLPKNTAGIGTLGPNSVNGKASYTPPCSKGPGPKIYIYTVYALSAQPQLSASTSQVNRDTLLAAIQDITLASAELSVTYTRK